MPPRAARVYKSFRPVPGFGLPGARYLFIGEGPGWEEVKARLPFYDRRWYEDVGVRCAHFHSGATGLELTRLMDQGGVAREDFYVTNLLKTVSPDDDVVQRLVVRDMPLLRQELAEWVDRKRTPVIVTCGRWATRAFLGEDADMAHTHGFTFPWPKRPEVTIYPVTHPAAGFHQPEQQIHVFDDFRQLGKVVAGQRFPVPTDHYPSARYTDDPRALLAALQQPPPFGAVTLDSEGDERRPWSLQVSFQPGQGFVLRTPIDPEVLRAFRRYLVRHRPTLGLHYALHDFAVARGAGLDLLQLAETHDLPYLDTMVLSYHLCRYPQGLKALAYRLCGMAMQAYEDLMRETGNRLALGFLEAVAAREGWPQLEVPVWKDGRPKIYRPNRAHVWARKTLAAIQATADRPEEERVEARDRWHTLAPEVREQVAEVLGPMPAPTLNDVPLADAVYYAGRDPDATMRVLLELRRRHDAVPSLAAVSRRDHGCLPMLARMQDVGFPFSASGLHDLSEEMENTKFKLAYQLKKEAGRYVNPNSPPQVAKLLFEDRRLPPGKINRDTGKPSTDKKSIEHLRGQDKAADLVIRWREHDKAGQFARLLRDAVREDQRVHFRWKYSRVSSGRLAAEDPNMLAIPAHSALGQRIRGQAIAPDGYEFITFDLDQIEMRVMADESQDVYMCQVFREGKIDIHSATGSGLFHLPVDQLDPHKHRRPSKIVNFGMINAIEPYGLFVQMRLAGVKDQDEASCAVFIRDWMRTYPGVEKYFLRCRQWTRTKGYTQERGGRIRLLPGIHSAVWKVKSEAERQSHSHRIQGGAQTLIKDAMVAMWPDLQELQTYGYLEPLAQIHDEIVFLAEEGMYDLAAPVILQHLTETTPLSVPVKAKGARGRTWNLEKK